MAYWRCALLVAGASVLVLAGCGGDDTSPGATPSTVQATDGPASASASPPATTPSSPVPSSPASSVAPPSAARVTVERSGGLTGIVQSITVQPNGEWTYRRDRTGVSTGKPVSGQLTAAQRTELQRLLTNPALAREAGQPPGAPGCADGYTYTLTVGGTKVNWGDCGSDTPDTAAKIIALLADATPF